MDAEKVIVRGFEERDRESVRRICRETGLKGDPGRFFFEDEEIIPLLYADYYLDHEPEACFVAEIDGRVVGYVIGSLEPKRRRRIMWTRIYPRIFLRILAKLLTLQFRSRETYRTFWWILTRSWRETLPNPPDPYPAHAHINMAKDYRGRHVGRRLSAAFRRHLLSRGVGGIHVIVREPEGKEALSVYLCKEREYRVVAVRRTTVWEKATGEKWNARLLVCDIRPLDVDKEENAAGLH